MPYIRHGAGPLGSSKHPASKTIVGVSAPEGRGEEEFEPVKVGKDLGLLKTQRVADAYVPWEAVLSKWTDDTRSMSWEFRRRPMVRYQNFRLPRRTKSQNPDRRFKPVNLWKGEHARCRFPGSRVNDNTGGMFSVSVSAIECFYWGARCRCRSRREGHVAPDGTSVTGTGAQSAPGRVRRAQS